MPWLGSNRFALGFVCTALSLHLVHAKDTDEPRKPRKSTEADDAKLLKPQVHIKGGNFKFGATVKGPFPSSDAAGSGQAKRTKIKSFAIDATTVTNEQFRRFVRDTKYKTEAETFAWSFVHEKLLPPQTIAIADREGGLGRVKESPHWVAVEGAWWRKPEGPDSNLKGRGNHPAVHISWNDAKEYCKWANGRRLPTEKEWEFAARGGLDEEPYPWEDAPDESEMNGWQGDFPHANTLEDDWEGTAPVDAYSKPNAYGMHNMLGNVWEWCNGGKEQSRPLRGGSYVDTREGNFNHALRVWTRMENSPDSGSHNTGFRCASGSSNNLEEPPKLEQPKPQRKASQMDQEKMQEIIAERGVEGLQEWMQEQGIGGSVMTPDMLQKKREQMKKQMDELSGEL